MLTSAETDMLFCLPERLECGDHGLGWVPSQVFIAGATMVLIFMVVIRVFMVGTILFVVVITRARRIIA